MIDKLAEHYGALVRQHGDSVRSCQYGSEESQLFRFNQLLKIADLEGAAILDIGCGRGDLYRHIKEAGFQITYTGIDLVEEVLHIARQKYGNARFFKHDIIAEPLEESFDYVFLNGVFNNNFYNSQAELDDYMRSLLVAGFKHCRKGMAFNLISSYVNFADEEMAYHDPVELLRFCIEKLGRKVSLFHHYERCDVAIFVYK
jgi:SAM-dependent methyltransferase